MNDKLEKLKKNASQVDLAEIEKLQVAFDKADAFYVENPTRENGQNRDYAADVLERAIARIYEKYFPAEKTFKSRLEALKFLQANKYKISRGKFYNDCPKHGNGLIKINADGSVPASEIDQYILKADLKKKDDPLAGIEKDHQRKARAEADHKETQVEISRLNLEELKGNMLPREQVKTLFVDRIKEFQRALLSQGRRLALRCAEKPAKEIQKIIEADNWAILEAYGREEPAVGNVGNETIKKLKAEGSKQLSSRLKAENSIPKAKEKENEKANLNTPN